MAVSPLHVFNQKKRQGQRIAVVSLYDAPSARLCCEAGADALLVGDSMGNVILGYDNTLPVTIDDIRLHTGAVARGAKSVSQPGVPVIADLPFGTYHGSADSIARHGSLLMQAGAHALKVEGGGEGTVAAIKRLVEMGAPVMGHLGFTPQSMLAFKETVQGKTAATAQALCDAARRLEDAGCFGVVLEVMPLEVAERITAGLAIPTIGIGAGPGCDGQVLVWHDLAGLLGGEPFRFVKRFVDGHALLAQAARDYVSEVHAGTFPSREHSWTMAGDELSAWREIKGPGD